MSKHKTTDVHKKWQHAFDDVVRKKKLMLLDEHNLKCFKRIRFIEIKMRKQTQAEISQQRQCDKHSVS